MGLRKKTLFLSLALVAPLFFLPKGSIAEDGDSVAVPTAAEQLFALANQTRAQSGAGRLSWDPALAAAALNHCRRMAAEGPIAHRYNGEADLASRAGQAGAHFELIEENVAVGPTASMIHNEWMNSPGHRENLLNPEVDRVGVAVVASRGVLYAVADYEHGVESLNGREVESRVAGLLHGSGVSIVPDASLARAACAMDSGVPRSSNGLYHALAGFGHVAVAAGTGGTAGLRTVSTRSCGQLSGGGARGHVYRVPRGCAAVLKRN